VKSDITRQTFDSRKHYRAVRMQQGRVQLDGDWNEQGDIVLHRIETEALDIIATGGPLHNAAFGILTDEKSLDAKEIEDLKARLLLPLKNDFLLTAGRYYVDGILCENETITSFQHQPDYPIPAGRSHLPDKNVKDGYLAYLDVWQRSIIAIDDPAIREIALGGPDTGTRSKTVWQVKLFPAELKLGCIEAFRNLNKANLPSDGTLSARTKPAAADPNPCIVPSGAGFRGLENQLYRVEIHDGGASFPVTGGSAGAAISSLSGDQVTTAPAEKGWNSGQAV